MKRNRLNQIINESIKRVVDEQKLRERVRRMVREALIREAEDEGGSSMEQKKNFVFSTAKSNKYDKAELARFLYPDKNEDSMRSYLSKQLKGDRPMSNQEINKAYQFFRTIKPSVS